MYLEKFYFSVSNINFPIIIVDDINKGIKHYFLKCRYTQAMVITDENTYKLHSEILIFLKRYISQVDIYKIPIGEKFKSFETLKNIFDVLIDKNHNRNTVIISFGGGVVGDLSGLVASIYLRGVNLVHIPTTFLSQVDSSIGGKTSINYKYIKNLIGSFYHPKAVIINLKYLLTISRREFLSGLAEVIKYAIIKGKDFFDWLECNLKEILNLNFLSIKNCIKNCCLTKMQFVRKDEYDHEYRNILNLGHTYGHAIESYTKCDGTWLHGEAVSVGIIMASNISLKLGKINKNNVVKIRKMIKRAKLPTCGPKNMTVKDYCYYINKDKKINFGILNLIIPTGIGSVEIYKVKNIESLMYSIN